MRCLILILLLIILYNMFGKGPCRPSQLCFLNQREGLTANISNIQTNTAAINSLQSKLNSVNSILSSLNSTISDNKTTWQQNRPNYNKTKTFAAQQEAKFQADYDY